MKPSFLNGVKPLLTAMIQCRTPDKCIEKIQRSVAMGADAIGIQLCQLAEEYRTATILREIFSACKNRPIYITSYRYNESAGMTDHACADLLLLGLKCGATLCDVMGDMFDANDRQITYDKSAVNKQKALIDEIHKSGGEVLISTHNYRYMTADAIVTVAKAQQERGADVIKIVTKTDNRECLTEYVGVMQRLKKELNKSFLFLDVGANSDFIRQVGPNLGVCMYLCVSDYGPLDTPQQPLLSNLKLIRDNMRL